MIRASLICFGWLTLATTLSACSGGSSGGGGAPPPPSDQQALAEAAAELAIGYCGEDSAERVTQDVELPSYAQGEGQVQGVPVSWSSSAPDVVSPEGVVTRPLGEAPATARLTATLTLNGLRAVREFQLSVAADRVPTPGGAGQLSFGAAGMTSVTLSWAAASDEESSAERLRYTVYYSLSDPLESAEDARIRGTVVEPARVAGITSRTVTGLAQGTRYSFNVVVEDEAGNRAAYTSASHPTHPDTTPPSPGEAGQLNVVDFGWSDVTLSWPPRRGPRGSRPTRSAATAAAATPSTGSMSTPASTAASPAIRPTRRSFTGSRRPLRRHGWS